MKDLTFTNKKIWSMQVFVDKQTDGRTNEQPKNYMSSIYPCWGIKKSSCLKNDSIIFNTNLNNASVKSKQQSAPIHAFCSSFYMYITKYSFQVTGCFPT